jgi:hypothetical protein
MNKYGKGVIRVFKENVTDLQKPAARDFEDILQASCFPSS